MTPTSEHFIDGTMHDWRFDGQAVVRRHVAFKRGEVTSAGASCLPCHARDMARCACRACDSRRRASCSQLQPRSAWLSNRHRDGVSPLVCRQKHQQLLSLRFLLMVGSDQSVQSMLSVTNICFVRVLRHVCTPCRPCPPHSRVPTGTVEAAGVLPSLHPIHSTATYLYVLGRPS